MTTEANSEPVNTAAAAAAPAPSLPQSAAALLARIQAGVKDAPTRVRHLRTAAPDVARNLWATERHWLFVILPLAFLLFRPLRWSWGTWFSGRGFFFGMNEPLAFQSLVLPATAVLVYSQRKQLQAMYQEMAFLFPEGSPKRRGQLWIVLVSCLLLLCGCIAMMEPLALLALILLLGSIVYYLYGPFILRALLGPLFFLFLIFPPPGLLLPLLTLQLQVGNAAVVAQFLHQIYPEARSQGALISLANYPLEVSVDLSGVSILLASLAFTFWLTLYRRVRLAIALLSLTGAAAIALCLSMLRVTLITLAGSLNTSTGDTFQSVNSVPFTALSLYLSYRFTVWLQTRRRRLSDYEADLAFQMQETGTNRSGPTPFESIHPDQIARSAAAILPAPPPLPQREDETEETPDAAAALPDKTETRDV